MASAEMNPPPLLPPIKGAGDQHWRARRLCCLWNLFLRILGMFRHFVHDAVLQVIEQRLRRQGFDAVVG